MLTIQHGDIFDANVSAIVNPANVNLLRGGGLCGVIHKRAGVELEAHCKTLGQRQYGDVVVTPAFGLDHFDTIIHACGPRWLGGARGEVELLKRLYQNLFAECLRAGIKSVAVPAISTGIYRFPVQQAAEIALMSACQYQNSNDLLIVFVNQEQDKHELYQRAFYRYKLK